MITAIIMASGLSTRMGENKLLLKYKNEPIIQHVFKEIQKCKFDEVIVVSQYEEIKNIVKYYNFKYVHNENAHIGQSESIKKAILNSKENEGYMFFVGDQPLIDSFYINKMILEFNKDKNYIIIPKSNERKGNPVIFPYDKKNELLNLENDEKGKKIITNASKIKYIEVKESMLFDIDTKSDYKKLEVEYEKN